MTISNEMIFYAGLAIIGFAILVAAVSIPAFFIIGRRLKKHLEIAYGKISHNEGIGRSWENSSFM